MATILYLSVWIGPGRFLRIARKAGNQRNTENFTKVTKYLTKFKEASINYVWGKPHVKKQ